MQEDFGGYFREHSDELEKLLRNREKRLEKHAELVRERYPNEFEAFSAFLDSVDWNMLHSIFSEYLEKSNVPKEMLNKIKRENVHLWLPEEDNPLAFFSPLSNDVAFFVSRLPKIVQSDSGKYHFEDNASLSFFLTLVHELTHSVSHNRVYFEGEGDDQEVEIVSGIWRGKEHILEGLNEAITERIAQEVVLRYFKRKGTGLTQAQEGLDRKLDYTKSSYANHVAFLEGICARVDNAIGLQEGSTWGSLKRGYFGEDIRDPAVMEVFSEIFDSKFLQKFSKLKGVETKKRVKHFGKRYGLFNRKQLIRQWRSYLGSLE